MPILVADNFQYQARKPLDSRIVVDTITDMIALSESIIYEGILVYNKETKKYYTFDPANGNDAALGKWRELETGSGGNASILSYAQDTLYQPNNLIIYNNSLYIATQVFTSDNTAGATVDDSFAADLAANNLISVNSKDTHCYEYKQNTMYQKDNLVYCGDRIGRVVADYQSNASKLLIEDSFALDIEDGYIVVDKISINELDEQLLKALPIVAFVTKKDIPRFESNMIIAGSIPTFRDGTSLSIDEKKGCNFLYIIDNNGELTGLAIVISYDEVADEFTVNAMKYGVGTADNIIPTIDILTKRSVGEIEIINKDDALNPLFIIKSTPPIDNTKLWYESSLLDASEIHVGQVTVKKYNDSTFAWDLIETIDVKDSNVVKNGNGSEWQYYRIQSDGNVFVSLAKWQLVYDTRQILGKIIDINTTTHELTIKIIHANPESDSYLTEDVQANVAIGAAPANFKYPAGMTFTEFVKKIALKDILANFTFTASGSGLKKKGTTINGSTLTVNITDLGNVDIKSIKFYIGNTLLGEYNFTSGTMQYIETYNDPIMTDTTFSAMIEQDKDYKTKKSTKITFVNPTYVGMVNNLNPTINDITGLQEVLKETKSGTYSVSMNDAHTCYAYPASMGNLSSIKDKNNFEYINSFTKTTNTINGELYNIYVLTDRVTAMNFTWIFG